MDSSAFACQIQTREARQSHSRQYSTRRWAHIQSRQRHACSKSEKSPQRPAEVFLAGDKLERSKDQRVFHREITWPGIVCIFSCGLGRPGCLVRQHPTVPIFSSLFPMFSIQFHRERVLLGICYSEVLVRCRFALSTSVRSSSLHPGPVIYFERETGTPTAPFPLLGGHRSRKACRRRNIPTPSNNPH